MSLPGVLAPTLVEQVTKPTLGCLLDDCFVAYIHAVPTAPSHLNVCGVYDVMNGTLQVIESTWNEVVRLIQF